MIGDTAEQATEIELTRVGLGNSALSGRGESTSWNDHAVVGICSRACDKTGLRINRSHDKARSGIDRHGLAGIEKTGIEDNHVSPQGMIGNDDGVT